MSAFNKWSLGSVSTPAFLPVTPCCTFMQMLKCNKSLFSKEISTFFSTRPNMATTFSYLWFSKQGFAWTHFNTYTITSCGPAAPWCRRCALCFSQTGSVLYLQHKCRVVFWVFFAIFFHTNEQAFVSFNTGHHLADHVIMVWLVYHTWHNKTKHLRFLLLMY